MSSIEKIENTFLDKLKEQSFTIIILVGVLYFQSIFRTKELEEIKTLYDQQIVDLKKEHEIERQRRDEREKRLTEQRDEFVNIAKFKLIQDSNSNLTKTKPLTEKK